MSVSTLTNQLIKIMTLAWLASACVNSLAMAETIGDHSEEAKLLEVEPAKDAATQPVLETWRRVLRKTRINTARSTPFSGLYELVLDNRVIYGDAEGRYLLFGEIYDTQRGGGFTTDTPATSESIPWNRLPLSVAVRDRWTDGPGDKRLKLAVLFDPWCPECPRLYADLAKAHDIDTHFLVLAPNDREGHAIVGGILCSRDPWLALHNTMSEPDLQAKHIERGAFALLDARPTPNQYATSKRVGDNRHHFEDVCDRTAAVSEVSVFARSTGLRRLPTLIAQDGRVHHGYLPLEELRAWLSQTH